MALIRLDIADFRNLVSIKLEPVPVGFNLIYGYNGSGKTSLLEAIYYLSLGRSFRSSIISRIIRRTADRFLIFAHLLSPSISTYPDQTIPIGIERQQQGDIKIRIAGKDVNSVAQLADLTPVQLINSHCCNLLDSGPAFRRKYVDWGVFYLNNEFLRLWREFGQILRQRNAALRQRSPRKELQIWTQELVVRANQLDNLRREYVERLLPLLDEMLKELLPNSPELVVSYQAGWDTSLNFADVLTASLDRDFQLGYTQYGPHRADLKITLNKIPVKDILSRGQQKLFVCAMILAQGALLSKYVNKKPIYLIDDLPAELDSVSRSNLIALLSRQEAQIFVTAVERDAISSLGLVSTVPLKMFHVEHGKLTEVSDSH
jgi:DNA replication and repair protein RecF